MSIDQQLFLLINREWTSPGLDSFMAAISSWGVLIVPVFILVALIFVLGGFRGRAAVLATAAAVGFADGGVSAPLKDAVGRPRPNQVLSRVRIVDLQKTKPRLLALFKSPKVLMSRPKYGEVRGKSFPSSHTVDNFCAAAMLGCFFGLRGWLYLIPAGLVGYSRIYTGSHWPSDVLTSMFLGLGIGLLCAAAFDLAWRRLAPRFAPALFQRHPSLFA